MMTIEIDDKSGFCFGVVRAIDKAEESLHNEGRVYCLGDIVHNKVEVQRLEDLGLVTIGHGDMENLRGASVLIRAHGEPPATYRTAERLGITIIDATCPVVARLQREVVKAKAAMDAVGGSVVLLGKRGHAEVVGLTGQTGGGVIVVENVADLDAVDFTRPIYLLSQTTQSLSLFGQVRDEILRRATDPRAVTVHDTICRQVSNRAPHLREFAARFDTVIFVSGRKSSNGRILFEACASVNPRSRFIEEESELQPEWFEGVESVGICGATSTPGWLMERVAATIDEMNKKP